MASIHEAAGQWIVTDGAIHCRVGINTRILTLGNSGMLAIASDDLPVEYIEWLQRPFFETVFRARAGRGVTVSFPPDQLGAVARAFGAQAANVRRRA